VAKSQLEIVLIDEGEAATQPAGPSLESVAAASTAVPAREREASKTAVETPPQATPERAEKRATSADAEPSKRSERQDSTAIDVAARVAQMTARAFGLGGLVSEIQQWQQTLREVGGLFKGAAVSAAEHSTARQRAKDETDSTAPAKTTAAEKQDAKPTRQAASETSESGDNAVIASVKNFVRVTAPKAFSDFTNGAIDALRTFMGQSGQRPTAPPTAVARSPATTSAPDDRQQTIKVEIPQTTEEPSPSAPVPRAPAPTTQVTPTARPAPTRTDDSRGWPGLHFNRRPVEPTPPPIIRPTSAPAPVQVAPTVTAARSAPLSGVAAWTSAAAPATRAATVTAAPAVAAATGAPVAATAVPAASGATAAAVGSGASTAAFAAGGIAGIASALTPVGAAAVAVSAAFAALAVGTTKLISYFGEEAQKLAGYSSQTAAAVGESETRREHAMLARSDRVGPQMAQFERFRGKSEERMMDIGTSIQGMLLSLINNLEPFIDKALSTAEAGMAGVEVLGKHAELMFDAFTGNAIETHKDLKELADLNKKFGKELTEIFMGEKDDDPLENDFLKMFGSLGNEMAVRLDVPRGRRRAPRPEGP
jgi:hypothetical protein